MSVHAIAACLCQLRAGYLADENQLASQVYEHLCRHGFAPLREVYLTSHGRVDLLVDGICVELKLRAKRHDLKQLERYLRAPGVEGLILVAARTVDLKGLQKRTKKPCVCVSVWGNWGVSV